MSGYQVEGCVGLRRVLLPVVLVLSGLGLLVQHLRFGDSYLPGWLTWVLVTGLIVVGRLTQRWPVPDGGSRGVRGVGVLAVLVVVLVLVAPAVVQGYMWLAGVPGALLLMVLVLAGGKVSEHSPRTAEIPHVKPH